MMFTDPFAAYGMLTLPCNSWAIQSMSKSVNIYHNNDNNNSNNNEKKPSWFNTEISCSV